MEVHGKDYLRFGGVLNSKWVAPTQTCGKIRSCTRGNPSKAHKQQEEEEDEKRLHKDQSLIKKTGRKTYQNLKN